MIIRPRCTNFIKIRVREPVLKNFSQNYFKKSEPTTTDIFLILLRGLKSARIFKMYLPS